MRVRPRLGKPRREERWRLAVLVAAISAAFSAAPEAASSSQARALFVDDFENGLDGWRLIGERGIRVHQSGDPGHGRVLELTPHGDVVALIRGSEDWGGVRFEGEMLFPTDEDNYLGIVYNFQRHGERADFGLVYVKGNDSYLRVNPHRDFNVGRTLYEEYRTPLTGAAAIRAGEWQSFRAEIVGATCHLYIGPVAEPQITFSLLELDSGALGLQPRSVGGAVWVDNVRVTAIEDFSWDGPPRPRAFDYEPQALLTDWSVIGPLERTEDELARRPAAFADRWRPFATDDRGAVISARVVDYHGPRGVAYFRTRARAEEAGEAVLHLSTVDDLAVWVNGRFHWFVPRGGLAWFDFFKNDDHAGRRIPVPLVAGDNEIVIRVRGGVYASGGFFARLEAADPASGTTAALVEVVDHGAHGVHRRGTPSFFHRTNR